MQVPRLPAAGDASVVKELRSVLFSEPILAAVSVQPKGYTKAALLRLLGWALLAGPLIAKRATEPLPPTILYIAVTPVGATVQSGRRARETFDLVVAGASGPVM